VSGGEDGGRRTLRCADGSLHSDGSRYLNREVSQVEFNARVLGLATDADRPLMERAKFVAICAGNQDEFFQKRVGGLRAQVSAGAHTASSDGMSPAEQLEALRRLAGPIVHEQSRICQEQLFPALAEVGMALHGWRELSDVAQKELTRRFVEHIFPILTPLAIDPGRPFPHISSLSLNVMVVLSEPGDEERRLARLKVPGSLPRYLPLDDAGFIAVEEVIAAHLEALFPGMEIIEHHLFRVTRNADIALEGGDVDDLLETIEDRLLRRRFGEAVRLEIHEDMAPDVRQRLVAELELTSDEVYEVAGPLDPSGLWFLYDQSPPELREEPWEPVVPATLADTESGAIFAAIAEADLLVHHPYESFDASVGAFVRAAAEDPRVVGIKLTMYRTSESESAMVDALVRAAESGKQAVAVVELKARFDEEANIRRARILEEAGVHVVYGFVGLKTHTKTLLVVREEDGGLRHYAHVGTGNYNPRTARLYEDLGLLTADPAVGEDLSQLFNTLTGFSRHRDFKRLLVAPRTMRERLLSHIRDQADADEGRIVVKVNNLVDTEMIEALYEASEAGAEIDLIVRSQCCLRPGRGGLSDRIRVRSIVGEFLEHSRIYRFGPPEEGTYYIGSADLMGRNLDRRFEALVPVRDESNRTRLEHILQTLLADDVLAWELGADGRWTKPPRHDGVNAHEVFKKRVRTGDWTCRAG
jgi:polyphosphate kinase